MRLQIVLTVAWLLAAFLGLPSDLLILAAVLVAAFWLRLAWQAANRHAHRDAETPPTVR